MIVVVGIFAVLGAVVIPNTGHFIGEDEQGSEMHLMIIDKPADTMTARDNSNSSNATRSWTSLPEGGACVTPLAAYLSNTTTSC